jgi:transposase-like protein
METPSPTPAAPDEERTARRRAYKNAWQQAQRLTRKAADLCQVCGTPCSDPPALKGFCDGCAAKVRERDAARRAAERALREKERLAARNRPNAPACPHCGGRDLMRGGSVKVRGRRRKKRFRCRACARWSYGRPLPAPADYPCPACGGRCWKNGRALSGRQLYICTKCRRKNTDLWPSTPRSPGGPFRRRITLYLGITAHCRFIAYCNATGQSGAQAVRTLFRQAAQGPVFASARRVYGDDGRTTVEVRSARLAPTPTPLNVRLPDLRARVTGERMRRRDGQKYLPTVYVCSKLSLALDERSWEGLLRTMQSTGMTHQEAARHLIARAPLPNQVQPTVGRRRDFAAS